MYSAVNKRDGEIYTAEELQAMTKDKRKKYKVSLHCEFCDEKVTFVKKGVNGRVPCFRAKHKEGCPNMSRSSSSNSKDKKEKNVSKKDYNQIDLTFNFYNEKDGNSSFKSREYNTSDKKEEIKRHRKEPTKKIKKNISFGRLLTYGLKGILNKQTQKIVINGETSLINEITCNFKNLTANMEGEKRLFWGNTYNVGSENWINKTSYIEDLEKYLSIRLNGEIAEEIWYYLDISPNKWCEGIPIMVYGKFMISSNKTPFIPINNSRNIYVSKRF